MRACGDLVHLLRGIGKPDGDGFPGRTELLQAAIVEASAIAKSPARTIPAEQGGDDHIGGETLRIRRDFRPECTGFHPASRAPGPELQRRAIRDDDGHADPGPGLMESHHGLGRVNLRADRAETGNDEALRLRDQFREPGIRREVARRAFLMRGFSLCKERLSQRRLRVFLAQTRAPQKR